MKFLLSLLALFAILVAAHDALTRSLQATENPAANSDRSIVRFSDTHQNITLATPDLIPRKHRRTQQIRTILIIRVVNNGEGPTVKSNVIQQYVFTDPNSLKAQMMRCSSNDIVFNAAPYGSGGVVDVSVRTSPTVRELVDAAEAQASQVIGVADLRKAANHILFILPKIKNYFAEAEVGGGFSFYNNEYGVSLSVLMHEMGHNFGLDHAGVGKDEYADYSGNMGRSLVRRGGPLMCFNAANHWNLGWFRKGRRDLGTTGPATPIKITLTGFSSYPSGNTFLVKIGNVFMQYNHAFAHNIDTDSTTSNQLVVVQSGTSGKTFRLAVLDEGEEYRSVSFVVRVCSKKSASMEISIGRSSADCAAITSLRPPLPVAPRPASQPTTAWGNNWFQPAPGPTPTSPSWWNSAPTQPFSQPTMPFPTTTVIWFPQPSAVASPPFLRPSTAVFSPSPPTTTWVQTPPSQPSGSNWFSWKTSSPWACLFGC